MLFPSHLNTVLCPSQLCGMRACFPSAQGSCHNRRMDATASVNTSKMLPLHIISLHQKYVLMEALRYTLVLTKCLSMSHSLIIEFLMFGINIKGPNFLSGRPTLGSLKSLNVDPFHLIFIVHHLTKGFLTIPPVSLHSTTFQPQCPCQGINLNERVMLTTLFCKKPLNIYLRCPNYAPWHSKPQKIYPFRNLLLPTSTSYTITQHNPCCGHYTLGLKLPDIIFPLDLPSEALSILQTSAQDF